MFDNISRQQFVMDSTLRSVIIKLLCRPFFADMVTRVLFKLGSPMYISGVRVELTNRCNLSCATCPYPVMKRKKGDMDINTFRKIVDQSGKFRFPIYISGFGEPLLYPHLEEALKYLAEHGYGDRMIATNGLLLDDDKIDLMIKYCKIVRIAVDSAHEDLYRIIRKSDDHKLLCENVRKLIARSEGSPLNIQIQFLRTRFNKNETIDDFKKIFGEHKNVVYYIKDAQQFGPGAPDVRVDTPRFDVRNCWFPYTLLCIGWNGDCVICCFDYDMRQVVGNINENNMIEIWKGARANALRRQLKDGALDNLPVCKTCSGPV